MTGQSAAEVILISVNHSITLMGKLWLIVMVFLRVLILLLAGYPLYQDEQERFVCNTIQPGCANVCYDLFSPISLMRFWLVQLTTLCLPYIIFVIFVVHKISNGLAVDLMSSDHSEDEMICKIHQQAFFKTSVKPLAVQKFTGAYILHLMFRTLLEAGFVVAHYYLFGFHIHRRFLCQHPPCTTQVDCYISRPTEKTVMLNFMLGVGALSLFLNVLDFICAIKRSVRQRSRRKVMVEKMYEEKQCYISAGGESGGVDPTSLSHRHLEVEAGHTRSFRNRLSSRSSSKEEALDLRQEASCLEHSSLSGCHNDRNNGYSGSQEEDLHRNSSEVALCPPQAMGSPRSIRVSKRGRLKPPPPPRRVPRGSPSPIGDASTATAGCARVVGQYTLVELDGGTQQTNDESQEKRSEWV
ncbi:gap junction delta-4 protein [Thalassophryne amazonica]|uniref:gap junction delta-4 protein n=1 Tax=Thalassophryne amazonica TaxID=390379 RepID=UPI001471F264|nr:gap junction delta-4 protein [Thalassophryne amazonica]